MRKQFNQTILELSETDDRIIIILGDVSVYLFNNFKMKYPDRFYNMGICENTLISVAAGLSSQGFFPFVHTIAPFITERCFEQIKLDMCYNSFGGNIVSCGASFDYAWDGATHHSYTDLAILRLLPDIEVIQPGSKKELDHLIRSQYNNGKTTYFRLSDHPHDIGLTAEFGKGLILKDVGANHTIMTAGPILGNVLKAVEDIHVNLVYFNTIKPIDAIMIDKFKHTKLLIIHDAFGLYEAITSIPNLQTTYYGMQDKFLSHYGTLDNIRNKLGLDVPGIRNFIVNTLND